MGIPFSLFTLSWQTLSTKREISTHIHNCVDSLLSLCSILKDIIHQERLQQIHGQCVGISSLLFPLSWWTPSIKREWSAHIQNVRKFLFLSSLYLDKHPWTKESELENELSAYIMCVSFSFSPSSILTDIVHQERMKRACTHTHTHNVWVPFISLSAILTDIVHQGRVKETHR